MKVIVHVLLAASFALLLTGCALLQSPSVKNDLRRAGKLTLTAYAASQNAILVYGRLPDCTAARPRLCKEPQAWRNLQTLEKAAANAIVAAEPVLNGDKTDTGELLTALAAMEQVSEAWASLNDEGAAP